MSAWMRRNAAVESDVEKHLLAACRQAGFLCLKFTSPARSGVPDRALITRAATVFVELKRPGQTPRRQQEEMQKKMRRAGAVVANASTTQEVDELIARLVRAQTSAGLTTQEVDPL